MKNLFAIIVFTLCNYGTLVSCPLVLKMSLSLEGGYGLSVMQNPKWQNNILANNLIGNNLNLGLSLLRYNRNYSLIYRTGVFYEQRSFEVQNSNGERVDYKLQYLSLPFSTKIETVRRLYIETGLQGFFLLGSKEENTDYQPNSMQIDKTNQFDFAATIGISYIAGLSRFGGIAWEIGFRNNFMLNHKSLILSQPIKNHFITSTFYTGLLIPIAHKSYGANF